MILYFSGTGNCLAVAKKLAEKLGDNYLPIDKYEPGEETLGVVYPVYYGGLPVPVKNFFEGADLKNIKYLYAVATYGGDIGGADCQIKSILSRRNARLDASFGVIAPDNFLPMFNPPDQRTSAKILEKTEEALPEIAEKITNRATVGTLSKATGNIYRTVAYPLYLHGRKTKKFFADENCVGCGQCEKLCPAGAITVKNNRPEWTKPDCYLCLGCINRCPRQAIQYGKSTVGKNRYVNPILKK